ncbi:hypothetical protein BDA96_04G195900 [Sorghum bicolor]|uniref:Cyclin N-terminal domain-containing protein n=1 Tax=Sorghum bicolor TaxID=4558 RepID=A0A921UIM8_SORBI|nr:hypothetical protein BDA96_04G195900 [Sorghum bicolor]
MCTVAPFVLRPNLAGADTMMESTTVATPHAEVAPAPPAALPWCDYGVDDDANDIDALLRDIHAVVRPRTPAAAADLPMPPPEFLARSRRRHNYRYDYYDSDFELEAVLRGIPSVRIPAGGGFASVPNPVDASDASPRTPPAAVVLPAPLSYGDDAGERNDDAVTIKTSPKTKQHPPQYDYDADIDATFRTMETEAMERPSPNYLSDRQQGEMMMVDRADLVEKMHRFSRYYDLAPGAFHRAVSFVDRFLSAKKISGGDERDMCLLGAAAVFAAAKYEDRKTVLNISSDHVAMYAGCTRGEAVGQERELVAVLGYRLSGPTAYTFVDHFMRHSEEEDAAAVRALAHHLADMALLDYRCVAFLPSAVAASAIFLARMVLCYWRTATPVVAGYRLEELSGCIQAIYDMHENLEVWPGCAQMMQHWEITAQFRYFLPPLAMLIG